MHLISTLVVQAGHTTSKVLRDLIPQNYASESSMNMHTKQDAASFHSVTPGFKDKTRYTLYVK
jgi:hypothetical protein